MKGLFTLPLLFFFLTSLASPPTLPSTNLSFNAVDGGYFNIGWSSGNGARRIMIAKAGSAPTFVPQNGIDYTSSDVFGQGQQVAPGEFVVFDHFSSSFFLTGLTPATQYFFRIFEYNGTGATTEYLTSSFLSGSGTTSATPTAQTSNAGFPTVTANSVSVNWQNGNGLRRLIVVREGAPVNADPVSGQPYNANSVFGNGATTGAGNFAVYGGSSTATTVTNLKPGTQYFFAFYEYNGSQQPQYKTPAYTASVTTRSMPTVATSGLTFFKRDGKELTLNWVNGNGQRRIVVAKQGSDPTTLPANGTDYNANAVFGQGQQLGTGEFVVYDDNFTSTTVSGLAPGTTYFFRVYEYDGTGANTLYLTSSFAAVSGATVTTPTQQSGALPVSNVSSNALRINLTPGNGRARLVIGRSGSPVSVNPSDFTVYTDNANFGTGQDLGDGNFVLAYTTETWVNVQNLQPNTTYHFAIFELNGINQPLYLRPASTISAATLGVLPVKLASWEAVAVNGKVELRWKTTEEINANRFVVERSADGAAFVTVTTVTATGNANVGRTYRAEDNAPLSGKAYYRLVIIDNDGRREFSSIRVVFASSKLAVKLLANPVQHSLQVILSAQDRKDYAIVNMAGQTVGRGILLQGRNEINVAGYAPGRYWLVTGKDANFNPVPFLKQ